jgi:hypothetical protein
MFCPDAHVPCPNRNLIYFGACIIAGLRLARERQVNVRVIPISTAVEESLELAHDIYMRGNYISGSLEHVTKEGVAKSAAKLVPPNSILVVVKSKEILDVADSSEFLKNAGVKSIPRLQSPC